MCTDLRQCTGKFEENNVRVLELNTSPEFALMKLIAQFKLYSLHDVFQQCHCQRFWIANFFALIVKELQLHCTVVYKRSSKFKVCTLNKHKSLNLFLHNIVECLTVSIKKGNVSKLGLKGSTFEPIVTKMSVSCLAWTHQRYKDAIFCKNLFFHSLSEGKKYPVALHRLPA